jgi:hypothetical protein
MLKTMLIATALVAATTFGIASAAPLGPQAAPGTDGDLVTLIKSKGPGGAGPFKGPIGPIKPPIGPIGPIGPIKPPKPLPPPPPPPKGGKHWHGPSGGIVIYGTGGSSCDATAARCAGLYGTRTTTYRRCLRRSGC